MPTQTIVPKRREDMPEEERRAAELRDRLRQLEDAFLQLRMPRMPGADYIHDHAVTLASLAQARSLMEG